MAFPTISDTNRAVKPQKRGRGLKFCIKLYFLCSKNKDADQLCGYCTAHMHLCFAYANSGFPHDVALMDAGTGSSIHQRGQAKVIEV